MAAKNKVVPGSVGPNGKSFSSFRSFRWYLCGFIGSAFLLALVMGLVQYGILQRTEHVLFFHLNHAPDWLRGLALVASIAPEALWFGAAAVVIAFGCKMYHLAWRMAAAILVGVGAVELLRHVVSRPDLTQFMHEISVRSSHPAISFPSLHVAIITIIMFSLLPYLSRWWRLLALLPILLMGLARVYLGAVGPFDATAGFAIGLLLVCGIRILPRSARLFLRFEAGPVEPEDTPAKK